MLYQWQVLQFFDEHPAQEEPAEAADPPPPLLLTLKADISFSVRLEVQ